MKISIIAGIGKNNELGKQNALLWHLPADLKHFKDITSGHPILMGQRTFESIGKPLPNRRNVVLTRDENFKTEGVDVVYSFEEAFNLFKNSDEEVFIIGGAEIYRQAMTFANKLYITHIEGEDVDADVFFPEIKNTEWKEIAREYHEANENNLIPCSFVEYKKI